MIVRRALLQRTLAAAFGIGLASPPPAVAGDELVVLVRQPDGQLVMVTENDMLPVRDSLPAAAGTPAALPAALGSAVTEGAVGYWMSTPAGSAYLFRLDTGAAASWWWLDEGDRPILLPLPDDLEPAFSSGAEARWFHGAVVDEAHLGSGTLRLLAVDLTSGEIVLDHGLDRRLELAATAVTPGGEVVAHAQGVVGGVEFWVADLRSDRVYRSGKSESTPSVAPGAIALQAAVAGDGVIVAAELAWSPPARSHPLVMIERYLDPNTSIGATLDGELIAIVPESSVEVDTES